MDAIALPIKRVSADTLVLVHWVERRASAAGEPAVARFDVCRTELPAIVCDCRLFLIELAAA
jgi:hypothetical protein